MVLPASASATVSVFAAGIGLVDAVTMTSTVPSTGSVVPSEMRILSVTAVPFLAFDAASTTSLSSPSMRAEMPFSSPPTRE